MKFLTIIFSFVLIFNATNLFAGNNTDSLLTVYKNEQNEKAKTLLLLKIAESYSTSNIDTVILICKQAKLHAENLKDDSLQLACCAYLVKAYTNKPYSEDSALSFIPLIEKLIFENKFHELSYLTLTKIGDAYKELYQFANATMYYQKAVEAALLTQELSKICAAKNQLGEIYWRASLFDKAMDVFTEVATLAERDNHLKNIMAAYRGIGICYDMTKDYNNSSKYFKMALDAALKDKEEQIAYVPYGNYAVALGHLKKYDEAIVSVKKAVELGIKYNQKNLQTDYQNLAGYYKNKGNLDSAIYYGNLSLAIAEKYNQLPNQSIVHTLLAEVYQIKNDYQSAFAHLKKSKIINDSLNIKAREKAVVEMEAVYGNKEKKARIELLDKENDIKALTLQQKEIALREAGIKTIQKETEIALLNKDKELQELKLNSAQQQLSGKELEAKSQTDKLELMEKSRLIGEKELAQQKFLRNGLFAGIILFSLIGVLLFNRFQLRKKIEQQSALLNERKRISNELHDDVGSTLSSISIYSEAIKNKLNQNEPQNVMELVNKIGDNARETISNLSDIVWSINPVNDSGEKVFNRMESIASSVLSSKNIQLNFNCDQSLYTVDYTIETKQNVFLIFKEAINNAAKYSKATAVKIDIKNNHKKLIMLIADDGIGFSSNTITRGNGLKNMHHRAKELKGTFSLNSSNSGTSIELQFPLS